MRKKSMLFFALLLVAAVAVCIGLAAGQRRSAEKKTVRIGVCVYKASDTFIASIVSELEQTVKDAEKRGGVSIKLDIADGKESQTVQNEQVERYISLEYDVICVNIVDRTNAAGLVDKAQEAGIPLVFFNREPVEEDIFRGDNIYYIGSDARKSAILQGEMILKVYGENPQSIDRNGNGSVEYIMLEGEAGHQDTIIRTEYSVKTLEEGGMKLEKMAGWSANFDRNQAFALMEQWLEHGGEVPELILSNNDDMALGAADAMARQYIGGAAIVGIDGIPAGIEAVQNGSMLGTVVSDASAYAGKMFELSYALAENETPGPESGLENGRYCWIPWRTYTTQDAAADTK